MSPEAILLFTSAALALAAYLISSSMRNARREREEVARAQARAEQARREAEAARQQRVRWEARLAEDATVHERQREAIVVGGDPRGLGDGLGVIGTGRFLRPVARDVPAPFSVDQRAGV